MQRRVSFSFACLATFGLLAGSWIALASEDAVRSDLSEEDRARVRAVTAPAIEFTVAEPFEAMSGGAATDTGSPNSAAFSQPSANLDFEGEQNFLLGNGLFRKLWVSSPSSTQASDGLGPLFNARSCQRCHLRDGRGHPPAYVGDTALSMLIRLSIPPQSDDDAQLLENRVLHRIPEPTYGGQLQDHGVPGLPGEGRIEVTYEEFPVALNGGETVMLREPNFQITELGFGPMHPDTMTSPRIAPPMIGLGLLDAIHPDDILAIADPEDSDGDGISGRVSWVRNPITDEIEVGRFGWKANTPSVRVQSADAFSGDIGISTPLFPISWGDCTPLQSECLDLPDGVQERLGDFEASQTVLDLVVHYSAHLAVPVRRDVEDLQVLEGKDLFYSSGCAACHWPKFVTSRDAEREEHRFQLIWPYTDMLLHDMGEGLSDHRPLANADANEWRTPPLWGIGLTQTVNGHTFFLHDGRARNLLEAILWHGGEAQNSRDAVVNMTPAQRAALLRFLESL